MIKDHLGNEFNTQKEMCKYYGVSTTTFRERIKKGWSLKEALTRSTNKGENNPNRKELYDHHGNKYYSQESMCAHYGISQSLFLGRIKRGYSLEEALTAKSHCHKVTDHLGNEYLSNEDMAKAYGISKKSPVLMLRIWSTALPCIFLALLSMYIRNEMLLC